MSVDFNTKTIYIYTKKIITLFFDWHKIVVLSRNDGCYKKEGWDRNCVRVADDGTLMMGQRL
jgi:hypothetical protein